MIFISILIITALSIAGSAAFFSVYGLVQLFKGISVYVLIMGSSLELGKLVSISYLYRYWNDTSIWLKTYLMSGILALMILTSMGIFGLLSVGYQTDSLPLKQIEQQVQLMDEEKIRLIDRKKQIDSQIANLPADFSKGRLKLMTGFKSEQEQTTARISALDKEILETKTKLIQTEAHIGPITYIAKALGMNTDDATKYLIYLIIFVFDPMAVALTLAVNIAMKKREEENTLAPNNIAVHDPFGAYLTDDDLWGLYEEPIVEEPIVEEPIVEALPPVELPPRRVRPYGGMDVGASLDELLQQHQYYERKESQGDKLTADERWAYQAVKDALHRQGFNIYI